MAQLTILSLSWGIQSFTLAAMAALGDLPKPDLCLNVATGWERTPTRQFATAYTPWLIAHGIPVHITHPAPSCRLIPPDANAHPPFYTLDQANHKGQLIRKCTYRFKVRAPRKWINEERRRRSIRLVPGVVENWLGFSTDEAHRARPFDVKYILPRWPLLELHMSRQDCTDYLHDHHLPIPVKSSCIICPLRDQASWLQIRNHPPDWQRAVEFDNRIRHALPQIRLYIHNTCMPLDEI